MRESFEIKGERTREADEPVLRVVSGSTGGARLPTMRRPREIRVAAANERYVVAEQDALRRANRPLALQGQRAARESPMDAS